MNTSEKREALFAVAEAYLDRGKYIQYDQRCMDRKTLLTPRRIKLYPPEAATEKNTVFLDCSSFVGAMYYETFGIELPADLTWHMIDYIEPRVYFYEFTHEETPEELEAIERDIRAILLPGDIITYDRISGSGHTMLYIGDGKFTHCTSGKGNPDSYDYVNKKSREYENGGLWVDPLEILFAGRLFGPKTRRVSISRPLDLFDCITERTRARLECAKGLVASVLTSPSGGATAEIGETVEYRVKVKNKDSVDKKIEISFAAPKNSTLIGESRAEGTALANGSFEAVFYARVEPSDSVILEGGRVFVNGLDTFVNCVKVGAGLSDHEKFEVCRHQRYDKNGDATALELAAKAYGDIGISIFDSEKAAVQNLFYLHDCTAGDVLCRKNQIPCNDGAVYSMFGGTSVATPEMIRIPHIRCTKVMKRDLFAGDIIVVSDDVYGKQCYSLFYTGEALFGKTDYSAPYGAHYGEEIDEFLDSLLGRCVFLVLRPSAKKRSGAFKD